MTLKSRVERIEASIDVTRLSGEQLRMLDVSKLTLAQIQALDVTRLTDEQLRRIDFETLTHEQLEALIGSYDEETRKWLESLSDEELEAIAEGRWGSLPPYQPKSCRERVVSAGLNQLIESEFARLRDVMSDEEIKDFEREALDEIGNKIQPEAERLQAERKNREDRATGRTDS